MPRARIRPRRCLPDRAGKQVAEAASDGPSVPAGDLLGARRESSTMANLDPTVPMYIIAIGWIYVVLLMSFTEDSIVAGLATFLFYGLLPLALLLYLLGTPQRRRNRRKRDADPKAAGDDGTDATD